jgi:hypothetical protein
MGCCLSSGRSIRRTTWTSWRSNALGEPQACKRLQQRYEALTGDRPPERLIAWYTSAFSSGATVGPGQPGALPPDGWLVQADRCLGTALAYSGLLV